MFFLKKIIFTILFLSLYASLHAQVFNPTVIASDGGFATAPSFGSFSFTVGESITTTISDQNYILTQGFQQPEQSDTVFTYVPFSNSVDFSVRVYPNPVNNLLRVYIQSSLNQTFSVQLFDVLGRKMAEAPNPLSEGSAQTFVVNTESLTSGMYLLNISTVGGKSTIAFKIVKINE